MDPKTLVIALLTLAAGPHDESGRGEAGLTAVAAEAPQPATRAARRVMKRIDELDGKVKTTRYQHRTEIRRKEGFYGWDCSGMVAYILRKAAPKAREAIDRDRPVAISFVRMIKKAPTGRSRNGWKRLRHIEDARPGDLFAWKRPPDFPSKNTGHVGFILDVPKKVPGAPGAYAVRIADASSYTHADDTRDPEGEGGYGKGTIVFQTDGNGQGTAYGWYGNTTHMVETPIYFGRVTK